MACKHERIKSVNCVLFCIDCGEKLPSDALNGQTPVQNDTGVKQPEKGEKQAPAKRGRKAAVK